ncbi:sensor histidine kinase [Actinoallomurus rhizosphaericola]|uniref:sensor histidine kinase n=1 Tax=Actinoallomurus rhizosphaericola TaxID=2952536 RepID=UPI0020919733|nr:sensor histidine kinase KdpD [Actinoallomurus rhizosphaericola]MCO5993525.1 sensor histidine kinase KdpD [Actinoallomurus rhizosphaericola]
MATRGRLKIYLGAAPGVGKTYAMLGEAHRRLERGADLVVGYVETYGRARTVALLDGLETVPGRETVHRDRAVTEMDVDAILARRPEGVLVDELAHTNVPGVRNEKRWQDVEELLEAGIDVISTVNVQHLESLTDVVERITEVRPTETVPDEVVRRADQIELVDMAPESLRRRLAHGTLYAPERIDAELASYFRVGNLTALRELALLWLADRVDDALARYRDEKGITDTWEARERIVVALTGGPEGDVLIRRAARIAARAGRADLVAVHVARGKGLRDGSPEALARQRALVEGLGGSYHQVTGDDVPKALLEFARAANATQIVLGSSRRNRWQYAFGPGVGTTVARASDDVDVHIVTHDYAGKGRGPAAVPPTSLGRGRRTAGWLLALFGPPALTAVLSASVRHLGLPTELLFFLALAVGVALVGGLWPAIVAAVAGFLLVNWFFTPPVHTLTVAHLENALALLVFVTVAVAVSTVVDLAARRSSQAARARSEATTLSMLATSVLRGEDALPELLERVRETFGLSSVTLLERSGDGWAPVASAGTETCGRPGDADVTVQVSDTLTLALDGRVLPAADRRVLAAFAYQAAAALDRQRLAEEAKEARRLAEGNRIRTALLAAVSHDLRTPLASIKASVSSLRSPEVRWDADDEAELLATIEESADRLDGLVANLLDMSRLQTGVVNPLARTVALDEVIQPALANVPGDQVKIEVPDDLPPVVADPGLLERSLANVVENAVRHGGPEPVRVTASEHGGMVELRVTDRGPGVPDSAKSRMFEPFQRLGDRPRGSGVGLGLAVARGFAEAVGGDLHAEDTPGGGLTMVFSLPTGASPAVGEGKGEW